MAPKSNRRTSRSDCYSKIGEKGESGPFFSAQISESASREPGSSCPAGYFKIKIDSKIIATTVNLLYGSCSGFLSDILRQEEARDRNVNMI